VTAVDLPIVSWVAEATEDVPCLALSIKLDMSMVRELLSREEIHVAEAPSDSPAMSIGETTPEFLNACCRLVDLLDNPQDIPFLSGLIQREIIYRVLRGRVGARLRSVATLGDQSHRTAKAIAWIAANYAKPLSVEELAQVASMGVSTLHHHFRMLTAMSPLQYQKQLRLQSARSLMLSNGLDAATAALRSATKALRNSAANTAASTDNPRCETFERFSLQVLRNSNRSVACELSSSWSTQSQPDISRGALGDHVFPFSRQTTKEDSYWRCEDSYAPPRNSG
jgi:AraC-like DNA-binding protein